MRCSLRILLLVNVASLVSQLAFAKGGGAAGHQLEETCKQGSDADCKVARQSDGATPKHEVLVEYEKKPWILWYFFFSSLGTWVVAKFILCAHKVQTVYELGEIAEVRLTTTPAETWGKCRIVERQGQSRRNMLLRNQPLNYIVRVLTQLPKKEIDSNNHNNDDNNDENNGTMDQLMTAHRKQFNGGDDENDDDDTSEPEYEMDAAGLRKYHGSIDEDLTTWRHENAAEEITDAATATTKSDSKTETTDS